MAKPTRSEPKWIEMPSLPSKSGNLSMDPGQITMIWVSLR